MKSMTYTEKERPTACQTDMSNDHRVSVTATYKKRKEKEKHKGRRQRQRTERKKKCGKHMKRCYEINEIERAFERERCGLNFLLSLTTSWKAQCFFLVEER